MSLGVALDDVAGSRDKIVDGEDVLTSNLRDGRNGDDEETSELDMIFKVHQAPPKSLRRRIRLTIESENDIDGNTSIVDSLGPCVCPLGTRA